MNALIAFTIGVGSVIGVFSAIHLEPIVFAGSAQRTNAVIKQSAVVTIRGTVEQVADDSFVLLSTQESKRIRIAYDEKSTPLIRDALGADAGVVTRSGMFVAPREDILQVGGAISATVWVTQQPSRPYALMLLKPLF